MGGVIIAHSIIGLVSIGWGAFIAVHEYFVHPRLTLSTAVVAFVSTVHIGVGIYLMGWSL